VFAALGAALLITPYAIPAFAQGTTAMTSVSKITAQSLVVGETTPVEIDRTSFLIIGALPAGYRPYAQLADTFVNNPDSPIQWPFYQGVVLTTRFGGHDGLDMNPGLGTPITAIAAGVVSVSVDDPGGLGTHIVIDHVIDGEKVSSVYGHMLLGSRTLKVGDRVKVGDQVGLVGSTGASTGPHLHYGIYVNGVAVDPYAWTTKHVTPLKGD
jgi:murein DD-endopeptidase MepM/ murein hydrolase activator NlpD